MRSSQVAPLQSPSLRGAPVSHRHLLADRPLRSLSFRQLRSLRRRLRSDAVRYIGTVKLKRHADRKYHLVKLHIVILVIMFIVAAISLLSMLANLLKIYDLISCFS